MYDQTKCQYDGEKIQQDMVNLFDYFRKKRKAMKPIQRLVEQYGLDMVLDQLKLNRQLLINQGQDQEAVDDVIDWLEGDKEFRDS